MSDFPKYPTDFVAMVRPFEDEEIEKLLSQSTENVAFTIDVLKNREVNATRAYQELKDKITNKITELQKKLDTKYPIANQQNIFKEKINLLESLLS